MWKIRGKELAQKFNQRKIFDNISFEIRSGESIAITGANGSGKTTLLRIISQLLRPSAGKITFHENQVEIKREKLYVAIGLVGPYLQLYNQLTALENYSFFRRIRGLPANIPHFKKLMSRVGLAGREADELRNYSSGMLQRMKYVCALLHEPEILLVDEPTSNLDEAGSQIVFEIMEQQKKNKILILATNNKDEVKFGDSTIELTV
ncbi:ABC transporter ATP-binding protein [candidate division KSB1 bacterium]|nr:ABC transporter ATP-binding protein [candidate division KSB1 bacterium]